MNNLSKNSMQTLEEHKASLERREPIQEQRSDTPKELIDAGMTLKNLEFLNHLGLKEEMFNQRVMEKVMFLSDKVADLRELQDLDMRIGDDGSMPKIDRLYSYLKLKEQADRIHEEEQLIRERMDSYGRR